GHGGEDLTRRLLLAALDLAQVAQGHARATGHLTKGLALLQTQVTKDIADLLTYQDHVEPPSHDSVCTGGQQYSTWLHPKPRLLRKGWESLTCNGVETPGIPGRSARSHRASNASLMASAVASARISSLVPDSTTDSTREPSGVDTA